jgi:hypothetical protein
VLLSYPWDDINNAFSGIPPHISVMQELTCIKEKQLVLVDDFIGKMRDLLETMGVDGGRMSENNLRTILNEFQASFTAQMGPGHRAIVADAAIVEQVENGRVYSVHCYLGKYRRVPVDWRFPRAGVFDLWRQWWIGDGVRKVPPLKMLQVRDVDHLDGIPLDESELHGRTGKYANNRQAVRKTLNDMSFLMGYVTGLVEERGTLELVITPSAVDRMFNSVADAFSEKERDAQIGWVTVMLAVRKRLRG